MAARTRGERVVLVERRRGGMLRTGLVAALLVVAGIVLAKGLPSLDLFGSRTVDRSPPPVLKSIEDLSQYHAATARLQQIVDVERDDKILPSFIHGTRTTFVATGSVDAVVDFDRLDRRNIVVSKDGRAATITLPAPHLAPARVDLQNSRVVDRDRGLVDRVGGIFKDSPTSERAVILAAQAKLRAAAAADRGLITTAQDNTRRMLTQLLQGIGVKRVTVRFQAPPAV
jgi:hypothetical protein